MARGSFKNLIALAQILLAGFCAGPANAGSVRLETEIGARIPRVQEFEFIREEAEKLGIRAWLFGGTAAGYAHYVKWDLDRQNGDARYQKDRFDYDYTNIYRSTQDLDVVVDGAPQRAEELQKRLVNAYPHFQGSKSAWEVRLLRQDMGDKQALLNNPNFLDQHTDSNSTGMIEITHPSGGEPVVRDLRDWNSKEPRFLKDVQEGTIHYYFSPKHTETSFFKAGRNPQILSVVRYLTKAFQYDLKLREEDLAQIKKIVDEFDPHGREMKNDYVRNWLLKKDNGRKLYQAAVNLEYARRTLDQLGLRTKLMAIENNPQTDRSLAWWMNKQPLESHPIGQGDGKTAKELGIDLVAHEAKDFLAYESITKAHTGDPNVFISRAGQTGEAAIYGNGFYTAVGNEGARGTGFTIRFHLNPNAREGTDFIRPAKTNYVVVLNRSALRVIPESLNLSPSEFFEMLAQGKQFDRSDLGIFEKLKRRMEKKLTHLSEEESRKIAAIVKAEIEKKTQNIAIFDIWFQNPISLRYPELLKEYIDRGFSQAASFVLMEPPWKDHPASRELIEYLFERGEVSRGGLLDLLQNDPLWVGRDDLLEKYLQKGDPTRLYKDRFWINGNGENALR